MPAWTPRDLTNSSFVQSQLSPLDRNYALEVTNRELSSAQPRLAQLEAELEAADNAANNKPDRRVIRELLAKAQDQTLSQAERDASSAEAARLQNERDRLTEAAERILQRTLSTREYVSNLVLGQSNLLQAGAVSPGQDTISAPSGYEGRKAPAAQVPDSQNPNPVPTADDDVLQQSVPTPIAGATQEEADFINAEAQRQAEFELGATQEEANFIRAEEQLQVETELGATQNEADFITRAQLEADQNEYAFGGTQAEADFINEQKSISDQEAALGAAGASQAEADAINQAVEAQAEERRLFSKGTTSALYNAQSQASQQDSTNAYAQNDWRVRLQLAPGSKYLYNSDTPGILAPLITTRGVLFPYTPAISVNYAANYDATTLTHSNYKIFQYGSSSVDQISISCDFTAQDAMEARYLLAVIHFFRSVTKMFYGQDKNPLAGTPPPLCYITGMGQFQFDRHPLVISSFNMSLPTDVDYIRAANATNVGVNTGGEVPRTNTSNPSKERLNSGTTPIGPGGIQAPPSFPSTPGGSIEATYVPTKMQIQISAYPIVTRNDISNNFSLEKYATGELLRGSKNKGGAGIW